MRFLVALFIVSCCVAGYAQDSTETPKEVTQTTDEGDDSAAADVAQVDSQKDKEKGCGCGSKGKL